MDNDDADRAVRILSKKLAEEMMSTLATVGGFQKPRPTALRLSPSGRFEVVEVYDDGRIIEPPRRCCWGSAIHAPGCKFWATSA